MGCAGVTTFNALRRSIARPGDLVAVLGLGGLGHPGVQLAAKLGFETVAIARDVEETLRFAALTGVRALIETRPLDEVQAAYDRMMSGDARCRMVLTTGR